MKYRLHCTGKPFFFTIHDIFKTFNNKKAQHVFYVCYNDHVEARTNMKGSDDMLAATYVKGGRVYDIREKDLDKVFADRAYGFTDDADSLKQECHETIRNKGKVYAVFFKKKLVGLYILERKAGSLNLRTKRLTAMDDLVSNELDEAVKMLVHCEIANMRYDRALWNEEIIDKDYRKSYNLGFLLPLVYLSANPFFTTFFTKVLGDAGTVLAIVMNISLIVFILVYYVKFIYGGNKK